MHTLNYITYASMTVHISVRIRGSRRQTQFQWQTLKQWGTHSIEFVLENYHQIILFVYFCFNTAPLCSSHSLFKPNGPHCWSALCPARSCINEYYHFCITQLLLVILCLVACLDVCLPCYVITDGLIKLDHNDLVACICGLSLLLQQ